MTEPAKGSFAYILPLSFQTATPPTLEQRTSVSLTERAKATIFVSLSANGRSKGPHCHVRNISAPFPALLCGHSSSSFHSQSRPLIPDLVLQGVAFLLPF
jgi:hypothetical protein